MNETGWLMTYIAWQELLVVPPQARLGAKTALPPAFARTNCARAR